ncbi:MAG: type II 3-dehydroquinate dehydratase [Bacteroidota bacterium]
MQIWIINGPNLNLLGKRQPEIYGHQSFEGYFEKLKAQFPGVELHYFQSNHEGSIIDQLHAIGFSADGIVLNGGAYTHTSLAIADAVSAIETPVIEVHISNIHAREEFRRHSYPALYAKGMITGLGLDGYRLAIEHLIL